jgi:hypothetical protein
MLQGQKPAFSEAFSARLKPCPPREPFMRWLRNCKKHGSEDPPLQEKAQAPASEGRRYRPG